jgi:hypothetical protein
VHDRHIGLIERITTVRGANEVVDDTIDAVIDGPSADPTRRVIRRSDFNAGLLGSAVGG